MNFVRRMHPPQDPSDISAPRILLVSYHFPPSEATGGVRWAAFARRAVEQGWGVDVLSLDPSRAELTGWDRVEDLSDRIRIFGVDEERLVVGRIEKFLWRTAKRARDLLPYSPMGGSRNTDPVRDKPEQRTYPRDELPAVFSSPRALLRAYWAWKNHASSRAWARRAAEAGLRIFEPGLHHLVVSSGPPHLAHWGARRIRRATGLPLVLDFRDAWSVTEVLSEELASPVTLALASRCEAICVSEAALLVANTEPLRDRMREEYPDSGCRMISVPNGYDESGIQRGGPRDQFVVAYAGAIYLDRDPRPLMRAVERVTEKLGLGPDELTLELMGHVDSLGDVPLTEMAEHAGIRRYLRLHPPGPRSEAMDFLARASVLVSLPQDLEMAIPSKIFDYMQFDAWIVAQARPRSASARLLKDTRAAVVDPEDVDSLASLLEDRYGRFRKGERPAPLAEQHPDLSRRAQADRLLAELERLAG